MAEAATHPAQLTALTWTALRLAKCGEVAPSSLRNERFELWPRELASGVHEAVVAACRSGRHSVPAVQRLLDTAEPLAAERSWT